MKNKNGILSELQRTKQNLLCCCLVLYFLSCVMFRCRVLFLHLKIILYSGGIFGSPWVGFKNFEFSLNQVSLLSNKNTILYNLAFLIINNTLQITVAIILSELTNKHFKKFTQSLMFLPYFISWVVVGAFIYNLFNYEFGAITQS